MCAAEVEAESRREPVAPQPRHRAKPHPGRQTLPDHLPRIEQIIPCSDPNCPQCGAQTAVIGYDVSEQLDMKPAQYFVRVTKREKRSCEACSSLRMPPLERRRAGITCGV